MPVTSRLRKPGSSTPRPSPSAFKISAAMSTRRQEPSDRASVSESAETKRVAGYHGTPHFCPKIGPQNRSGTLRLELLPFQESNQTLAQPVKLGVIQHRVAVARPSQRH